MDTWNPLFRKQLTCFNVYITGCYHVSYLFYSYSQLRYKTYEQKHPSRGVLLKSFPKSFINSLKLANVDLKFKQKRWKINVKNFILWSVGRTIQLFGISFHIQTNCCCSFKHIFAKGWWKKSISHILARMWKRLPKLSNILDFS